mmetsp:Transcript_14564/g.38973  ORF Transcript_14564/g.38973 Transcript_14564/m.38973 type:complete len:89 (-) Transcript_14564:793-1059(-)
MYSHAFDTHGAGVGGGVGGGVGAAVGAAVGDGVGCGVGADLQMAREAAGEKRLLPTSPSRISEPIGISVASSQSERMLKKTTGVAPGV